MISFLKNLWGAQDADNQRSAMQQELDEEQQTLLRLLKSENPSKTDKQTSNNENKENGKSPNEKTNCFQKIGVVTSLLGDNGIIDEAIFFEMDVATHILTFLKVGSRVKYLAYVNPDNDHVKVVKIIEIIDDYWNDTLLPEKLEQNFETLKIEKPRYFTTQERNVLALVMERQTDSILVEIDEKQHTIKLDDVEIGFSPMAGDRVVICCDVQKDDQFVDGQGEILREKSIKPARMLKGERCVVQEVLDTHGIINDDCYFALDALPNKALLKPGVAVIADMIECERGSFVWRCIRLSVDSRDAPFPAAPTEKNLAVFVKGKINHFTVGTFKPTELQIAMKNNTDYPLILENITLGKYRNCIQLVKVIFPSECPYSLAPRADITVRISFEAKVYGKSIEYIRFQFPTFMVKRTIAIFVAENEEEQREIINSVNGTAAPEVKSFSARNRQGNLVLDYANRVWSQKQEIIPGIRIGQKRRFVAVRVGLHEVSEKLRALYLQNAPKKEKFSNITVHFPAVNQPLCSENYSQRFQVLVFLEELECFVGMRKFDRDRAHFEREGEFLSLFIENLAERRPSLVLGDSLRAQNPWTSDGQEKGRTFEGVIHKVLFDRILLKFSNGFHSEYNGEDYRIEFYFSRFLFRKQHFCIKRAVKVLGDDFLFPTRIRQREPRLPVELDEENNLYIQQADGKREYCPWFNPLLNPTQRNAVKNILRGETEMQPYIIFGPPGTGKTITLVELIIQISKHCPVSRIIVATPSNSAADLITTRLIESGALPAGEFVRLVAFNLLEKDLVPTHLMPYCVTTDNGVDGTCSDEMTTTASGLKFRCKMSELGRNRVTIGTCGSLGNLIQLGFPKDHFTHIIVDEAGQCTEPESLLAITQVSSRRGQVILAGDHCQLQSPVMNNISRKCGLATSFMERILKTAPYATDHIRFPDTSGFDPRLVTKLIYNYRSLPSILNIYNELFYNSELKAMVREKGSREAKLLAKLDELLPESKTRPKMHGAFFYSVKGENRQEMDSPSWYNPTEAKNVFLITIQLYRHHIQPASIGIITPYARQVKHLRALFTTADIAMPKIGTVEEFQGQERDIILISTVRSSVKFMESDLRFSLGFVKCPRRLNVAISRARYLLFIFGNPEILGKDSRWRACIKYCADNDAYLGANLPKDFDETEENDLFEDALTGEFED